MNTIDRYTFSSVPQKYHWINKCYKLAFNLENKLAKNPKNVINFWKSQEDLKIRQNITSENISNKNSSTNFHNLNISVNTEIHFRSSSQELPYLFVFCLLRIPTQSSLSKGIKVYKKERRETKFKENEEKLYFVKEKNKRYF